MNPYEKKSYWEEAGPMLVGSLIIWMTLLLIIPSCVKAAQESPHEALASTIAAEACGDGWRQMVYVAATIHNRAIRLNQTPYQIVRAKNQYYGFTNPNRQRIYREAKCKIRADWLAKNISTLPDYVDGAIFFRQSQEKRMIWHKIETIRYKNHIYYK